MYKSQYNYTQQGTSFKDAKKVTKSEFLEECDINNIVAKAATNGGLPTGNRTPLFDDFSVVGDYTEIQNQIVAAKSLFEQVPSSIREKFNNDVATFLDFIDDPKNSDEAAAMGLISKTESKSEVESIVKETEKSIENSTEDKPISE